MNTKHDLVAQLISEQLLHEGLFDRARDALASLFSRVVPKGTAEKLQSSVKPLSADSPPNDVVQIVQALKLAGPKVGERVQMDDVLRQAAQLSKSAEQEAEQALEADAQEASEKTENTKHLVPLSEAGLTSAIGVGLAVLSGVPMLFGFLAKASKRVGAERLSAFFDKVYHVTHHAEERVVDTVIPDKLSYIVYAYLWKRGIKLSDKLVEFPAYKTGEGGAKKKVKSTIYSALLIYLAWSGLKAAAHAGVSLLGAAEGAATAVKGTEIARAGISLAQAASSA